MNIKFTGSISGLEFGISEIAKMLGVTVGDGGYTFEAIRKNENSLSVSLDGKKGTIVYNKPCHFFRAMGLAVERIEDGCESFSLTEPVHFDMNGPMFDVSQGNAAFNIKTAKNILRNIALMGLSMMMIYCEDSFEVRNQPYFGYMRPRYSEADMRELDDYAYALGIEMIPCIQTLAHLPDALRWSVYSPIRDYEECLMVGKPETYDFLRDVISSAARPFRTKKIHIGMDEAWKLGRGKYIDNFGYRPARELMAEHLGKVAEIVRELGLEPMMWDDMFFRVVTNDYYDMSLEAIPDEVKKSVPDGMRCVYWDYYTLTKEGYDHHVRVHKDLCENMVFAGGIWTWMGYSLAWDKTLRTTEAALDTCKRYGVRDIIMTVWGDNGTECLATTTLIGCQLFAEHCYADKLDYEKLKKRFKFCTGGNVDDFANLELLDKTPQNEGFDDTSNYNASKYLMWQDILTGLCDKNIEGYELDAHYAALEKKLAEAETRNGQFGGMFEFSRRAAHVLAKKSQMGLRLTAAYKAGDRKALKDFAENELPELRERFAELRECHMKNWFEIYKPFGWDVMDMRYGSAMIRIDSAVAEIKAYLAGEMERIEELEEPRLLYNGKEGSVRYMNFYGDVASPSRIAPKA